MRIVFEIVWQLRGERHRCEETVDMLHKCSVSKDSCSLLHKQVSTPLACELYGDHEPPESMAKCARQYFRLSSNTNET